MKIVYWWRNALAVGRLGVIGLFAVSSHSVPAEGGRNRRKGKSSIKKYCKRENLSENIDFFGFWM